YVRVLIVWLCVVACRAPQSVARDEGVHWPAIIDSHVHLAFDPVADQLRAHGVEVAVDLAAPERTMRDASAIAVLRAGPMLTHPNGYPLDAWGSDGYGIGCADPACVRSAIDRLADEGARVIKLAGDRDGLDPALMPVAVEAAHAKHLKVAIHALSDEGALVGARAGVDVLAHTPTEPLSSATIAAWRGRAVISTLAAFGAAEAVENLRKLRAAGLTILYGTDLGNLRVDGASRDEVELLRAAGLDDAAITAAMTTTPRTFWGLADAPDTYLVLRGDPRRDASVLLAPVSVVVHGKPVE
ncbi:MAG TPA: hypothetical protein VGC41_11885, partial [Kofleriaceae bacterium]